MAAILNTNMASLYAQKNLSMAQTNLATSVLRLSSGLRVNSAKDDAAALGLSASIMGRYNVTHQAISGLQNATSIVQTADGALDVVGKILQRALTLVQQKTDLSLSDSQKSSIDTEVASLLDQITQIRNRTKFNNQVVFDQTFTFANGTNSLSAIQIADLSTSTLGLSALSSNNPSAFPNLVPIDILGNYGFDGLGDPLSGSEAAPVIETGYIKFTLNGTGDGAIGNGYDYSGLQYDPTGTGNYGVEDYIAPGTPYEGFAVKLISSSITTDLISPSDVDPDEHTITLSNHGFDLGDEIIYHVNSGSNPIVELVDGQKYYVTPLDPDHFLLANTRGDAFNAFFNDPSFAIDITPNLMGGSAGFSTPSFISGSNEDEDPTVSSTQIWQVDAITNHFAVLKGSEESGFLTIQYMAKPGESLIRMRMSYTNTTGASQNVLMMRGTDPDVDSILSGGGTSDTNNSLGAPGISNNDLVNAIGPLSGKAISLYIPGNGYTHNVAIMPNWPAYSPEDILAGNDSFSNGDDAIEGAWDLGSVANGQTVSVDAYYILGTNVEETISTLSSARADLTSTDLVNAIQINATNRAELGAILNRLDYSIDNLLTLSNNLADATSRILDTDYAAETAGLTRSQILQQAATSMLAQANQMPNVVLTLLK